MTSSIRKARPRGRLLLAAGAAVCALALAACSSSGSGSTPAASTGKVTLTFRSWVPGISESVNLWNKSHPNIHVNRVRRPPAVGNYAKMFSALQAGNAPDLGQIEYAPCRTLSTSAGWTTWPPTARAASSRTSSRGPGRR